MFLKKTSDNTWLKKTSNEWKAISVDFDDTIVDKVKFPGIGPEKPGAREALEKLQNAGWKIIIFSVRANTPDGADILEDWLQDNEFPYDEIWAGPKPKALFYVDDRAIQFQDNWDEVASKILEQKK